VKLLAEARSHGDVLVVGINSDESVKSVSRARAGRSSPESDRAQVLGGLDAVDFVVVFDEDTPQALIEEIRPQVLVKGGDYTERTVVGAPFVRSTGGSVVLVPLAPKDVRRRRWSRG
jgi:rfaE bifunctional protein nucleotidyltransferase chain/domain